MTSNTQIAAAYCLPFFPHRFVYDSETVRKVPDPLPRQDVNEVPQPPKENLRILCSAISPCEKYIAFADDYKQLTVWYWTGRDDVSLHKQYNMIRRANKIVFDPRGHSVLAAGNEKSVGVLKAVKPKGNDFFADKSGDVFKFDLDKNEGQCLLGHLSMLLDVKLTLDGKHILTCDRDEKIRISSYPNAYNIHNFCLGHTDFVTCIEVIDDQYIVSGSGDGTLKSWNYLQGKELASVTPAEDAGLEPLTTEAETELQIKRTTNWPSILNISTFSDDRDLLAVSVENFKGLMIYNSKLMYVKKILTQEFIWEHHFIGSNEILVVQAQEKNPVQVCHLKVEAPQWQPVPMTNKEFFKGNLKGEKASLDSRQILSTAYTARSTG